MITSIILSLALVIPSLIIALFVRLNQKNQSKRRRDNFSVGEVHRNQTLIRRSARSIAF